MAPRADADSPGAVSSRSPRPRWAAERAGAAYGGTGCGESAAPFAPHGETLGFRTKERPGAPYFDHPHGRLLVSSRFLSVPAEDGPVKHARLETPEGSHIIRADGTVPRLWNTDRPVLHVLPELSVASDVLDACPAPRVACTATVLHPAAGLQLPSELVVRRPLPNRRHFVAGTRDSRYGFLVPLPPEPPEEVVLRFAWRFTDPEQAEAIRRRAGHIPLAVDHVLRLRLLPTGRGRVYSMDASAWPDGGTVSPPPCDVQPCAVLDHLDIPDAREAGVALSWDAPREVFRMDERLDVPGILLGDVWGLSEFEDEQLHEVGQTAAFDPASPGSVAHRANACVEMPAEVLVEAVRLALTVPYGEGSRYDPGTAGMAACEGHPALLALCGWWNANAPDPAHRRAGLCGINVRVREDGEYWYAYHETPNMDVDHPEKQPGIGARIGDVVLIQFHQGQHAATLGEDGCRLWDVAGGPWWTVGVSEDEVRSGEADEGWYVLEGLASFPGRFPAAWAWLTGGSLGGPEGGTPATADAEPDGDASAEAGRRRVPETRHTDLGLPDDPGAVDDGRRRGGVPAGRAGLAMLLLRFWNRLGRRASDRAASKPDAGRSAVHDGTK